MADIKVKDLTDTSSVALDNQIMVLTNDEQNQVQNITVENLLTNVLSSDNGNVLEQGTDGKLYVETPENITGDLADLDTVNKTSLVNSINEVVSNLSTEATTRANADNNLQSQIDAITAASDVTDIVGTYAQLQAYDTTGLADNSIIKVLQDESRQDETTYYRWVITGGVGAWVLIGEEGPYYTKSQADSLFATQQTTGNLASLDTSDKTSLVNAINELSSVLDPTQTADYINNSKAVESGAISSNSIILANVTNYAHSTFDRSKFTLVGSPNITDDGIASGFSNSDYLTKNLAISNASKIVIQQRIKLGTTSNDFIFLKRNDTLSGFLSFRATQGKFLYSPDSSNVAMITNSTIISSGNEVDILAEITSSSTTLSIKKVTDSTYTSITQNIDSSTVLASWSSVVTGKSVNGDGYSIDLKQFSITVDGIEVFSGNKTGIDTYIIGGNTVTIPYTLSKTGAKIVLSTYRSEVLLVYSEYGYAPYYTLSDTDFTLPQGELYGYLEKRARDMAHPVAVPFFRLTDEINEDEVRLEGAEVDKGLYLAIEQKLAAYCSASEDTTKIILPNFTNRVPWGANDYGYIEAGLPNITGSFTSPQVYSSGPSGAFTSSGTGYMWEISSSGESNTINFLASRSSSIYGNSTTVQPPAFKVRWLARWK